MEQTKEKLSQESLGKSKARFETEIDQRGKVDDLDLLIPDPEIFKLGSREYKIYPLPIKKQKLYKKLNALVNDSLEDLEIGLPLIAEILGEEDLKFVEDNFTNPHMIQFYTCIGKAENKGMEKVKKKIMEEKQAEK